jgi:hypothetical protein
VHTLAEAMIDGLYVHLLQKRAVYGIDPAQRLRLLKLGQAGYPSGASGVSRPRLNASPTAAARSLTPRLA